MWDSTHFQAQENHLQSEATGWTESTQAQRIALWSSGD